MRKTKRFYIDTIIKKVQDPKLVKTETFFTLFASLQMIDLIRQYIPPHSRRYMMDGTFDIIPLGPYYQLLLIYIEYRNNVSVE